MSGRILPMAHLSIRVPWHDSGWAGTICARPLDNSACLALRRIGQQRDDAFEVAVAGRRMDELDPATRLPCVAEHAAFMAPFELTRTVTHPYSFSPAHQHFRPTPLRMAPFSAACIPYRWMLRESAVEIASELDLGLQLEAEERALAKMGWDSTAWLQDAGNHRLMLETFFSAAVEGSSLAFFYAKAVPFTEKSGRVLVGVGRITHTGTPIEYQYEDRPLDGLRSLLWEMGVSHSIRLGHPDGFLLPYHEALAAAQTDPDLDPAELVVFAPEDHWESFSYGTEHVPHDGAVASLLAVQRGLTRAQERLGTDFTAELAWVDACLGELWELRGPYPGLASALAAFGVPQAALFTMLVTAPLGPRDDPWPAVQATLDDPASLGPEWPSRLGKVLGRTLAGLPDERRALLHLIARIHLTADQATRIYQPDERAAARIALGDDELLRNPYLMYEADRAAADPIAVTSVDRGLFPDQYIRDWFTIPEPSAVDDPLDPRRVGALAVGALEARSDRGDTLARAGDVVLDVKAMPVSPPCPLSGDILAAVRTDLTQELVDGQLADGTPALQLRRLSAVGVKIIRTVRRRRGAARHAVEADWRSLLDAELGPFEAETDDGAAEEAARTEKAAALALLAAARVSVLVGPAGTGKTTLLKVLCQHPAISSGGVLLLAPTGKAAVQLQRRIGLKARTLASYLLPLDRYDPDTGRYRVSSAPADQRAGTVIVDEASMLTEEQLGALLDGLGAVDRLVLVGDPRQLPPIGAGRPFVDIVAELAPDDIDARFPRADGCFAELTIRRRQRGGDRDDLMLAEWFSGRPIPAGSDHVWHRADREGLGAPDASLVCARWDTDDQLRDLLFDVLVAELGLRDRDDLMGFEATLGAVESGGWMYFNKSWPDRQGAGHTADKWQILGPVRAGGAGIVELNRLVQRHFRARTLDRSQPTVRGRKTPQPIGPEAIVYGDKVINTINRSRRAWPDTDVIGDPSAHFLANGEIGIVVGNFRRKGKLFERLEVEFSSQLGVSYTFWPGEFGDDGSSPLQLGYAITVHRSQGSEFGLSILVIPNPCRPLSRELLYTALTRQSTKVVVLHQGSMSDLLDYAHPAASETAQRLTNLFVAPAPVEVEGRFLEDRLIHRTSSGRVVRSKSELLIAERLDATGVAWHYEKPFRGVDGRVVYPDFTIDDIETGVTYYWEHLGMLADPAYRQRWEGKQAWYATQGVSTSGGPAGTLIVTQDDVRGGFDAATIKQLVENLFG